VARSSQAFEPATRRRLQALKASIDPHGVFAHGVPLG
jgi:FAD/FMN-containing dehydrogenase